MFCVDMVARLIVTFSNHFCNCHSSQQAFFSHVTSWFSLRDTNSYVVMTSKCKLFLFTIILWPLIETVFIDADHGEEAHIQVLPGRKLYEACSRNNQKGSFYVATPISYTDVFGIEVTSLFCEAGNTFLLTILQVTIVLRIYVFLVNDIHISLLKMAQEHAIHA